MGKFVIYKRSIGYDFHLKAGNGEAIGTSQLYETREECINGIESVMEEASAASIEDQTVTRIRLTEKPKFEIYHDKDKKFCFRLRSRNGQVILLSQSYTAKASCQNGIRSVMVNAPKGEVEESEEQFAEISV